MLPFRVIKHARLKRYSTPLPFQKRKISWQQSYKQGIILPDIAEIKPTHIIVGAGSAGCVLANRLSENSDNRVLLIEAGPRDHWWDWRIHMPAALMYNLCHDQYNWYYHTTAQKNLNNRVLYWPRGRVWGGSSTLNAMCFIRGNAADYDRWEEEGAVGWNFSNCLPYFKKMEAYQGNADFRVRGKDGPVHVRQAPADHPLHQAFLQAGEFHPIGTTKDLNGEKQAGIGRIDQTIKNGERWSASRAYLHTALERKNLFTSSGITCTKILTHKNKAIGIEFIRKLNFVGTDNIDSYSREKIYCEGDVILSGGAINSPHLLMISGIGPADHLRSMEIPVVLDLPGVGQNLQDHLEIYVQQKCSQPITLYDKSSWKFPHNMVRIGLEWLANRSGLASSSHLETGGFASSTSAVPYPDIQFHFLPSTVHDDGRKEATCHAFQVHVGPLRSKSSGSVTLQHKDPRRYPHMNPNYMSCDEDWKEFRRSIRMAREIFATKPFDPFRGVELAPGDSIQSDAELDNFIRAKAASAYHPSCSCKMGSSNDRMAVVNPENMSVYGIENLKVIDASVMPSIITGNLNAPTMMLAERAADLIQGKK